MRKAVELEIARRRANWKRSFFVADGGGKGEGFNLQRPDSPASAEVGDPCLLCFYEG